MPPWISVSEALAIIARQHAAESGRAGRARRGRGRVLATDIVSDSGLAALRDLGDGRLRACGCQMTARPAARLVERARPVAAGDLPPGPIAGRGRPRHDRRAAASRNGGRDSRWSAPGARKAGSVFDESPVEPGSHLRRRGRASSAGARSSWPPGERQLTPGDIALGRAWPAPIPLAVSRGARDRRSPRPATSSSPPEHRRRPGQIRDSNGPMLLAALRGAGAGAREAAASAGDDESRPRGPLRPPALPAWDVLVTSGGVSAGDLDLRSTRSRSRRGLRDPLPRRRAAARASRVAFGRPRPDCSGSGLPGNPVSSSVTFHLFVALRASAAWKAAPSPGRGARRRSAPRIAAPRRRGKRTATRRSHARRRRPPRRAAG